MSKTKIILSILVGLILTVITTTYLAKSKVKSVSHAALEVKLNQTPDYKLSLKSLSGENSYSSDYKLPIPYGYYLVKIIGEDGAELFSGKVEKNRVTFPPYEVDGGDESKPTVATLEPISEMTLLLPFFSKAKKIIFLDEKNLEILEVDISKTELPENYTQNFCGNGICDSNENLIFCYRDCHLR